MKNLLMSSLFVMVLLPAAANGQSQNTEQIVTRLMASGGTYYGVDDKALSRTGDASAVAAIKTLNEKSVVPSEIRTVLTIIHLSFSDPSIVQNADDRKPRATLFLLRYLNLVTTDQNLKQSIAEERMYVLGQSAKPMPNVQR